MKIEVSPYFAQQDIALAYTVFTFENQAHSPQLWGELIAPMLQRIEQADTLDTIKNNPRIQHTKAAFKKNGKDPARFRPSSDSLWRRVVQKKGLYQINDLVDVNNYLSLTHKLPIGSYDLDQLTEPIQLVLGEEGASYQGIGKDRVNLANVLVLKDDTGAFGSPISDSVRALITEQTTRGLLVTYLFGQTAEEVAHIQQDIKACLTTYLKSCTIQQQGIVKRD